MLQFCQKIQHEVHHILVRFSFVFICFFYVNSLNMRDSSILFFTSHHVCNHVIEKYNYFEFFESERTIEKQKTTNFQTKRFTCLSQIVPKNVFYRIYTYSPTNLPFLLYRLFLTVIQLNSWNLHLLLNLNWDRSLILLYIWISKALKFLHD